jgi:hypothetical protein
MVDGPLCHYGHGPERGGVADSATARQANTGRRSFWPAKALQTQRGVERMGRELARGALNVIVHKPFTLNR